MNKAVKDKFKSALKNRELQPNAIVLVYHLDHFLKAMGADSKIKFRKWSKKRLIKGSGDKKKKIADDSKARFLEEEKAPKNLDQVAKFINKAVVQIVR